MVEVGVFHLHRETAEVEEQRKVAVEQVVLEFQVLEVAVDVTEGVVEEHDAGLEELSVVRVRVCYLVEPVGVDVWPAQGIKRG